MVGRLMSEHDPFEREAARQRDDRKKREKNVLLAFALAIGAGIAGLLVFALSKGEKWGAVFGLGILAAGAAALVGAMLGFLFGLPRVSGSSSGFRSEGASPPGENGGQANGGAAVTALVRSPAYVNNNLLEISDWLTKIIVGAGLVDLHGLTAWIARAGGQVGAGVGLAPGSVRTTFGTSLLTFFFAWGFLFVYIHTRTIISFIFATTDRSLADLFKEVREELKETTDELRHEVASVVPQVQTILSEKGILDLLYQPGLDSSATAATQAERFLADPLNASNGRVWLYLACARGHQHAAAVREGASEERLEQLAQLVREALARALANDPDGSLRRLARGLIDARDENHIPGDDDLMTLADDEKIRTMLS